MFRSSEILRSIVVYIKMSLSLQIKNKSTPSRRLFGCLFVINCLFRKLFYLHTEGFECRTLLVFGSWPFYLFLNGTAFKACPLDPE